MWLWLFAALALFFGYSIYLEPRWFAVRRVRIQTKKKILRSFTILHLSDVHFSGKGSSKEKFLRETTASLKPDFILITGDIIDCDSGIESAVAVLGNLKARAGKFAIFGNHDYYDYHFTDNFKYHLKGVKVSSRLNDIKRFREKLEAAGIRVLVNQNERLLLDGMPFVVAGTDDPVTHEVSFEKTLAGIRKDSFNILLTHVLDSVVRMPDAGIDLVLAGHTHGGQFRIPGLGGFVYGFKLPRRYLDGVHELRGMITCGSRGVGASRTLAIRFFCRPEAILLEVHPS